MRVGVLGFGVVQIVGRDHRQAEFLAEVEQPFSHTGFDAETVIHQLEEEVVLAEDVSELGRTCDCLVVVTDSEPGLDLAGRASGGRNQTAGVLAQQFAVCTRLVEEPFKA